MACSIKKPNKTIRILFGVILIVFGVYFEQFWIAVIGIIPIIFAVIGFCPLCWIDNKK
ncbi:MAG: YgaP-like transmembrane domain [Arcobacteraceae bacterium]